MSTAAATLRKPRNLPEGRWIWTAVREEDLAGNFPVRRSASGRQLLIWIRTAPMRLSRMTPTAYISTWTAEVSQARKSERPTPGNRENRKKNLSLQAERVLILRCES